MEVIGYIFKRIYHQSFSAYSTIFIISSSVDKDIVDCHNSIVVI